MEARPFRQDDAALRRHSQFKALGDAVRSLHEMRGGSGRTFVARSLLEERQPAAPSTRGPAQKATFLEVSDCIRAGDEALGLEALSGCQLLSLRFIEDYGCVI